MIKIYGSKDSSAFRCLWLLEEIGLPYESIPLSFQKGENKSPEYLQLNPNGKVPTMVEDGFVLWESLVINNYLAEKHKPELLGNSPQEKALVWQWSLWSVIHLAEPLEVLLLQKWRKQPESELTKKAQEELPRWLKVLNDVLSGKEYLVGNTFTLADITAMSVTSMASFINLDLQSYSNITAWMGRLGERPALKKLS